MGKMGMISLSGIPNDYLLAFCICVACLIAIFEVFSAKKVEKVVSKPLKLTRSKHSIRYRSTVPHLCCRSTMMEPILGINSLITYIPINIYRKHLSIDGVIDHQVNQRVSRRVNKISLPYPTEIITDFSLDKAKGLAHMKGCERDSPAFLEMKHAFPNASEPELMRFLIARKGNVALAKEMYEKSQLWFSDNIPLKSSPEVLRAISTQCFFPHGVDRDGTPIILFRGACYDSTKAPSEVYVKLAAHAIDWVLRRSHHVNVTVLVYSAAIPGAANENTDTNFIKGFVQVLSDNFPERLKRLAIFPFPWYGRAIWSFVRVFIDPRTQEKVTLLPFSGNTNCEHNLPPEIVEIVDPSQLPRSIGGLDDRPFLDMESTLI